MEHLPAVGAEAHHQAHQVEEHGVPGKVVPLADVVEEDSKSGI